VKETSRFQRLNGSSCFATIEPALHVFVVFAALVVAFR
jgi:hypothetical protein